MASFSDIPDTIQSSGLDIFSVPVFDRWLIHAPMHEFNGLFTGHDFNLLKLHNSCTADPEIVAIRNILNRVGHVSPEKKNPANFHPNLLVFVTTRGCNLSCTYCHFDGPTSPHNSLDLTSSIAIIDWMIQSLSMNVNHGEDRALSIHFFGGEPFGTFELIQNIISYTKTECERKEIKPFFMATTNGVFSQKQAIWIAQNLDRLIISLDGPKAIHDKHRPISGNHGSFDAVAATADLLSEYPIEINFRACITSESVLELKDIVEYMTDRWTPTVIKVEPLTVNIHTILSSLKPPDPFIFAKQWYLAYHFLKLRGVDLAFTPVNPGGPRLTSCLVGDDAVVVHPDGSINACYLTPQEWIDQGIKLDIGRVTNSAVVDISLESIQRNRDFVQRKQRCDECFCQFSCAGGCHVTHRNNEPPFKYDDFCISTRLVTAALLLDSIGCEKEARELLDSHGSMQALAHNDSDRKDFREQI